MQIIRPSYYAAFRCQAAHCPDNCCQGWEVELDAQTATRYLHLPDALGDTLRAAIRREQDRFWLENHNDRCPMLRPDGLCRIQATLGEAALSEVCRAYPRIRQDYGNFVELCLEMSCPEAARLILERDEWTLEREQLPDAGDCADYDADCMQLLQATRPAAFSLLRDTRYSVPQRLTLLLLYGYHVQAQLDGAAGSDFAPPSALAAAQKLASAGDCAALFSFYHSLERLNDSWEALLCAGPQPAPHWDAMLCRFAQYGVYRYYYQAVSDYDLSSRIKMLVAGCILTAYMRRDLPLASLLQSYAKEIENSADNIDALLDAACTERSLTDRNLLGLLHT